MVLFYIFYVFVEVLSSFILLSSPVSILIASILNSKVECLTPFHLVLSLKFCLGLSFEAVDLIMFNFLCFFYKLGKRAASPSLEDQWVVAGEAVLWPEAELGDVVLAPAAGKGSGRQSVYTVTCRMAPQDELSVSKHPHPLGSLAAGEASMVTVLLL